MCCHLKSLFLLFSFPFLLLYLTSAPAREKYKFQGSNFTSVGDSWFSFFPFSLSIFCAVFCFLYFFSFFSCFHGQKFACIVERTHTVHIAVLEINFTPPFHVKILQTSTIVRFRFINWNWSAPSSALEIFIYHTYCFYVQQLPYWYFLNILSLARKGVSFSWSCDMWSEEERKLSSFSQLFPRDMNMINCFTYGFDFSCSLACG